jgi:hypothetical protein
MAGKQKLKRPMIAIKARTWTLLIFKTLTIATLVKSTTL